MDYEIIPFTQDHLESARDLFLESYSRERERSPLLPSQIIDESEWLIEAFQRVIVNPGVAIIQKNKLVAYMLTGFYFPFKGQDAVLVPEYCHTAVAADKINLYRRMYLHLAGEWTKKEKHIQLIGHFAHDTILQETLYQLGFGAILAERLRDLSDIDNVPIVTVVEEQDVEKLVHIHLEHNAYYKASPIFILKSTKKDEIFSRLESHLHNGDRFFVCYEGAEPCAYMIVGTSATGGEGFLLRNTNTAQIKVAYAQPHMRGKGVGKALLQHTIKWSQKQQYDRIFVEHETANLYGGSFWRAHFTPYLYFSMRYIDNRI